MQILQKKFLNCFVHHHCHLFENQQWIHSWPISTAPNALRRCIFDWGIYKQLSNIIHALCSQTEKVTAKIQACFLALLLCIWSFLLYIYWISLKTLSAQLSSLSSYVPKKLILKSPLVARICMRNCFRLTFQVVNSSWLTHDHDCLGHLSSMCTQRKAGRKQRAKLRLYPSHGPLRFMTSHSRFALASAMRKTKRLRRRLWSW